MRWKQSKARASVYRWIPQHLAKCPEYNGFGSKFCGMNKCISTRLTKNSRDNWIWKGKISFWSMNNSNNQRNSSIGKWMDKENGVLCLPLHTHTHRGILFGHKTERNLSKPFVTTWIKPKDMKLNELSQTQKDKCCMISLKWRMKKVEFKAAERVEVAEGGQGLQGLGQEAEYVCHWSKGISLRLWVSSADLKPSTLCVCVCVCLCACTGVLSCV